MRLVGGVGQPIDALEPRAVAEMEARHRIDRQPAPVARAQEIPGAARISGSCSRAAVSAIAPPVGIVERGEQRLVGLAQRRANSRCARSRASQAAKFGTGDSVTKVESFGISRQISSTTCLIRKLPNDTPASPRWQLEIE